MNQEIVLKLRHKAKEANLSIVSLIDEIETKLSNPKDSIPLGDFKELKSLMVTKRKKLKITLEDLELQTDISLSTLKRLMSDPSGAKFSNVMLVLNELGIESWAEL
jgi:hypothetical protein